jgi:Cu(I)/Ag(I) efflux system membrane fusion protein
MTGGRWRAAGPLSTSLLVATTFLGGYGYGRWYAREPVVSAKNDRRILYYRCPMHPSYRSDKAGMAPCCNMALQAVYADQSGAPNLPAGAIHVTPAQQQLIGVQYGSVEYARVSRLVRGAARVSIDESRMARVQTKLEGFIDHLYAKGVGDRVQQGQTLLTIYNRRAYTMPQMEFLQAVMDASGMGEAPPGVSDPEAKRLGAADALRAARQRLQMLGFSEDQIEAVARAHQALPSLPIYAPISGVIVDYHAALNQTPGMEPLLTIADLSRVWVTADFVPADSPAVRPGQRATLTVPYLPGTVFEGTVDTILPQLDTETRAMQVRMQFDNPGLLLKPEMYGEVQLRPGLRTEKLTVPQEAVVDNGRSQAVFADLGNGYLDLREVKTGERFGDRIEIVRGLEAGQRIVTSGNFLLDSESRMRPRH